MKTTQTSLLDFVYQDEKKEIEPEEIKIPKYYDLIKRKGRYKRR